MKDPTAILYGKRLIELRKSHGYTQQSLCYATGVKISAIQKLESGYASVYNARMCTIIPLARALGITVEDLISIDNPS